MVNIIKILLLLTAVSLCACTVNVVKDLIQFNLFGIPTLHKDVDWPFDPDVGVKRARQYQEINGRHGEKAIERLGLGIDGRDLERLEEQGKRDEKLLNESVDEENANPWAKLIQLLNPFYIDALHAVFREKCYTKSPKQTDLEKGVTKEELVDAINEVFGDTNYTDQSISIFNEIDSEETGKITWDQFLDFVMEQLSTSAPQILELTEPQITDSPHVKRETIVKIVLIETEKYFCYAVVSKLGCVGLYDGTMNFLTSYSALMTREDIARRDAERRRKNRWITDAIFVPENQMFFVTNTARNLIIYDASGLNHVPLWFILGLPNILHCLAYCVKPDREILYAGNACGEVMTFIFLQPKLSLLRKKHNDKLSIFYWQELVEEKDFLASKIYGKLHSEIINHIQYFLENDTILTCSKDQERSIIITPTDHRIKPYVFKMQRGANCFYLSKKLKVLLTGSEDGVVRIWNAVIPSKPLTSLRSHRAGIIDVVIFEEQNLFMSCSRDAVLKVWNLKEETCVHSLRLKYPCFKVMGKSIEWGKESIFPGPRRNAKPEEFFESVWERSCILITCCNFIATIKLIFLDGKERNFDMCVLSPPPLQNAVLIPSSWKMCNRDENFTCEPVEINEKLEAYIDSLKFILDKDLLSQEGLNNNINLKIAKLESKKLQMKWVVSQCAPYSALDLQEVEEIKLPVGLPAPTSKKTRALVEKTQRLLSAASAKSLVFSEASSSTKSRSSKSSIVEFNF